jgi:hypothetical protein
MRCQTAVHIIDKLILGFQDKVNVCENLTLYLSAVSTNYILDHSLAADPLIKLQTGANDARSDDTAKLKAAIAVWLNARESKKRWHDSSRLEDGDDSETDSNCQYNTPVLSLKGKDERGMSNNITGRLICPIDYDWDNPE